jgi:RNA polymerase sigma-70 factor (ECF subfamily)
MARMGDGATGFQAEQLLQHAAWVRRVAAHLVVDAARADDVAQQTLLAALTQPPKRTDAPRAWLASVVRSFARRAARSEARRERHESSAPPAGPAPPVHEVVARAETQRALVDAVLALDEPYRTALLLRFFENRSPRAIAKETRAPVETVRTRLKRGLELLRAKYVERRAQDWAVALVSLIEPRLWSGLRRLVAAKSSAASVSVAGGVGWAGVVGVLAMATKWKLAVAAVVLAAGAFTAVEVCRSPSPLVEIATASRSSPRGPSSPTSSIPVSVPAEAARTEVPHANTPAAERPVVSPTSAALEGLVIDSSGEPVKDAIVLAERVEHGRARFPTISNLVQDFENLARVPEVDKDHGDLRRAITGESGAFRFGALAPGTDWNVAAVERARGLALAVGVVLEGAGSTKEVELELLDGVVLHGTVRDPAGNPVPGAYVNVSAFMPKGEATAEDRQKGRDSLFLFALCGPDGTYRTLAIPFRVFGFQFGAAGYSARTTRRAGIGGELVVASGVHDQQEDCTLEPAPHLRGAIVNLDGSPARLAATDCPLEVVGSIRSPETMSALTLGSRGTIERANDRYEFACESGRPEFLSIWSRDLLLGWAAVRPQGDGPDLRIDLARAAAPHVPASLALEVVDGTTGRPISEFTLELTFDSIASGAGSLADPEIRVVHDESGRVRLDALNPGTYALTVRAPEFASRCVFVPSRTEPDAPSLRVEMRRAKASIAGRVVDRDGAPLVGATLCLRAPDGGLALAPPECLARANGDGAFRFDGVPEGDWFVVADHEDLAPAVQHARDGDANVIVTLEPGVLVGFTLVPDEGTQLGGHWRRILDEHGIPVVDEHRPGRFILRLRSNTPQRLTEGLYSIEFVSPKWRSETVRFRATVDAKVVVPLLAPPPSSREK